MGDHKSERTKSKDVNYIHGRAILGGKYIDIMRDSDGGGLEMIGNEGRNEYAYVHSGVLGFGERIEPIEYECTNGYIPYKMRLRVGRNKRIWLDRSVLSTAESEIYNNELLNSLHSEDGRNDYYRGSLYSNYNREITTLIGEDFISKNFNKINISNPVPGLASQSTSSNLVTNSATEESTIETKKTVSISSSRLQEICRLPDGEDELLEAVGDVTTSYGDPLVRSTQVKVHGPLEVPVVKFSMRI